MSKISFIFAALLVSVQLLPAQFLTDTPPPQGESNTAGAKLYFDYSIPLKGITVSVSDFKAYQDQPTLVYYFSALCPHCKSSYPLIAKVSDQFKDLGLKTIAVAINNNSRIDVLKFSKELKAKLPFAQDISRQFSDKYGVGHVPLAVLIKPDGTYIRYDHVGEQIEYLKAEIKLLLGG